MREIAVQSVKICDFPDKIYPVNGRITAANRVAWKWGREDCPLVIADERTATINAVGDNGWKALENVIGLSAIVRFAAKEGVGIVRLRDSVLNDTRLPILALYGMPIGDYLNNKKSLDQCVGIRELSQDKTIMFLGLIRESRDLTG